MRVLLYGYYGMKNTGDDALLAVANWGAQNILRADKVSAIASEIPGFENSDKLHSVYNLKTLFKGENRLRFYYHVLRSNSMLFGGGSVFHSTDIIKKQTSLLKLSGNGPHAALGVSVGPFRDPGAEDACALLLKRLKFAGLRDQSSLDIVRRIAPEVEAVKTFDMAALLPRSNGVSVESVGFGTDREGIGIALCNQDRDVSGEAEKSSILKKKMIEVIDRCSPEGVDTINFIDFNGHDYYGEAKLHAAIAASVSSRFKILHTPYCSDPMKVLRRISRLRLLISMRLHANVFGYLAQTPTVMLSYHQKCLSWASEIGMPSAVIFDGYEFDTGELANRIQEILSGHSYTPSLPVVDAERRAMKNWIWAQPASRKGFP
jgi:polysaccharide pyruvyl transferase WcaK-like protein